MSYTSGRGAMFSGLWILTIISAFLFTSCGTNKKITYFTDISDTLRQPVIVKHSDFTEPVIQSNDILDVSIQTIDPKTTSNFSNTGSENAGGSRNTPGFLVDANGNIELPLVGITKIGGLTTTQARDVIRQKASKYYIDPVVNVRFANFTVTVLGEVTRPSKYVIENEKVSVLDAIGLAGDLTMYGKRENVLLVREENGNKAFIRFNLQSSDIFESPYFYLKQGDMIYVEPNKARSRSATVDVTRDRYLGYGLSVISILISAYALLR